MAKEKESESLVVRMARQYRMEPTEFQRVVKETCMPTKPPPTDAEFMLFLAAAHEYGCNPLIREIYAFRRNDGAGIQPIVAIDGFLRKANEHPMNNGMQAVPNYSESGQLISVTATIHRKDRQHPTVITESLKENFRPNSDNWKTRPERMLRHRALAQAIRIAFGFAGVMEEDEYQKWEETTKKVNVGGTPLDVVADDIPAAEPAKPKKVSEIAAAPPQKVKSEPEPEDEYLDLESQDMLERVIVNAGIPIRDIPKTLQKLAGVMAPDMVKTSQLGEVLAAIEKNKAT